jgi:uncharacterized protein YegL
MHGEKIATINRAIKSVIPLIQDEAADNPEIETCVRAMKFGSGAKWHTSETKVKDFKWYDVDAGGVTDTGTAMKLLAQELFVEKMGLRAIPPVIILMSDGCATDNYEGGLSVLLAERWSSKTVRIAIAIGDDADVDELSKFCSLKFIKWASTVVKTVSSPKTDDTGTASGVDVNTIPTLTDSDDEIW